MSNEFDDLMGAASSPVDLTTLGGTALPPIGLPKSAIVNRAATVALSSDPQMAVENFQMMVAEADQGSSQLTDSLMKQHGSSVEAGDKASYMTIMSDPKVSIERKRALIEEMAKPPAYRTDTSMANLTKAASQGSKGETRSSEDARINAVTTSLAELHDSRVKTQQLVNQHASGVRNVGAQTVGEMAAYWVMPFGVNIGEAKGVYAETNSLGKALKAFALPGSNVMSQREALEAIPPAQRVEATKQFLDNLQKSSGIILSDNDFQEVQKAKAVLEKGGYDSTDKWLDNLSGLLDIVGLGSLIRGPKTAVQLTKAAKTASTMDEAGKRATETVKGQQTGYQGTPQGKLPSTASWAVQPNKGAVSEPLVVRPKNYKETSQDVGGQFSGKIAALEKQKEELLATAGNQLDKEEVVKLSSERKSIEAGLMDSSPEATKALAKELQSKGMSYKEASKEATKKINENNLEVGARLSRIDETLSTNKSASTAMQRVAEIEKEIESLKPSATFPSRKTVTADLISRIQFNSSKGVPNPLSPHETVKAANPSSARASHETIVNGPDEVAEALSGSNKVDAVANDVYPQHATESGRVFAQPTDIQRSLREKMLPENIWEFIKGMGRLEFTAAEYAAARAHIVNRFENAEGLAIHDNMSSFSHKGGYSEISAVYGTSEGAWNSAQSAIDQAKFALKDYAITDENIELLKKEGVDYVPTTLADELGKEGSYMIRVKTTHEIDPTDVANLEGVETKWNWLDRIPGSEWFQGGLSAYLFDAAARIDPKISKAASAATDFSARLEKLMVDEASKYSDMFNKLPEANKQQVNAYLFQANKEGIAFDRNDLIARGLDTEEEIAAVKAWRDFWDSHYYLENHDLVRSLNSEGYQLLRVDDTDFFVKKTAKNINVGYVYDASKDIAANLSKQFLDELYDSGGYVARIRTPMKLDGVNVEHVIVRNTPTEYTRKFKDSDRPLIYREGYYTVSYDAPRFVDKVGKDGSRRAVAVAGDSDQARPFVNRMNQDAEEGFTYEQRADNNAYRRGTDDWFDVESARGRIAQRRRGKLLEDASGMNHLGDMSYVVNPVDSAIRAARSISGRTVNRPMLEAAKERLKKQFAQEFGVDSYRQVKWPSSASQIGLEGKMASSSVADARTNWAYINYLENGYINQIDQFLKRGFFMLSEWAGEKEGFGLVQRGLLKGSKANIAGGAKQSVFMASIAANPLRQWVVQPHQAVRTFAYNPIGFPKALTLANDYFAFVATGGKIGEATEGSFIKFARDSGMLDGVDKQNLVRGTLLDAAEASNPATKVAKEAGAMVRKVGFDAGEQINISIHLASVYERYTRAGKNLLDPNVAAEAYQEARAISYEMNFAGDLPYNQNSFSMITQFLQIPHKALLQTVNRKIPKQQRIQLLVGDLALWGPPAGTAYLLSDVFGGDILPEDKEAREAIMYGLEMAGYNYALRTLLKDDTVNVDFSSLAPMDLTGFGEVAAALVEGGPWKAISESPAGQLFLKDQSRMQVALGSLSRFFGFSDPIGETPDEFAEALLNVGKIAGGINNAHKAYIMLEAERRYDAMGRPQGNAAHAVQAAYQLFGFGDMSQKQLFELSREASKRSKDHKDEVTQVYKTVATYYQTKFGEGIDSPRQMQAVSQFLLKKYSTDPDAQKIISGLLKQDMKDPQYRLMEQMLKSVNIPSMQGTRDKIKNSPLPEETKQNMFEFLDRAAEVRKPKEE